MKEAVELASFSSLRQKNAVRRFHSDVVLT